MIERADEQAAVGDGGSGVGAFRQLVAAEFPVFGRGGEHHQFAHAADPENPFTVAHRRGVGRAGDLFVPCLLAGLEFEAAHGALVIPQINKQAHEFRDPDDDWLWIAGLWEPGGDLGPCYTMVTTAASPLMAPIHDRMPAVLLADEVEGYINNQRDHWNFRSFAGLLAVTPCASPLTKPKDGGGQGELF